MSEDVQAHVKLYKKIGAALMVLTVVTVLASFIPAGVALGVVIALIIATVKGSLVATYFMHLVGERKTIYFTLLLTAFIFLVLIFIPLLGHTNTYGRKMIVPNSDAAVAADHGEAAH
jgi:cytochrome c oxidase subunit 4